MAGDSGESDAPTAPLALRAGRRANRAYHRRLGRRTHDPAGVDVVAADWDVCVVLDGCRPAAFEAVARDPLGDARPDRRDSYERRRSRGSHTVEWLWGNLAERELHDLVYVTANVQPEVYAAALDCHHVEHAWLDGFDGETVPPPAMTDAALAAAERFPDKRLLVHYLQPHYPFRGAPGFEHGTMAFWDAVAAGTVDADRETLRAWHRDNLEWVVPEVRRLLAGVAGRAVVTADHGTALGERVGPVPVREWGHPWGVHHRVLTAVPWLAVEGSRGVVTADPPAGGGGAPDTERARERLAALGYA